MKNRYYKILFYSGLVCGLLGLAPLANAQTVHQNLALCKGDIFRGNKIEADTAILVPNQQPALPDTVFHIHAILPVTTFLNQVLCPGESFDGLPLLKDTTITRTYPNAATGCDSIVYYVLTVKSNSALQITGDSTFCAGESRVLSVGFYPNYTWSTGEIIREKVVTTSGTYTVSITDADGCVLVAARKVTASAPQADVEALSPNCPHIHDGLIELMPAGGISPYTFDVNGVVQVSNGLFSNLQPGLYTAVVSDAIGCRDTAVIVLNEPAPLTVKAPEDQVVTAGVTLILESVVTGTPVSITWSPASGLSCSDCLSPELTPVLNGQYVVVVKNANGCVAADSVRVTIDKTRKIYIPNVFRPDTEPFTVFSGEGVAEIVSFHIFDRWGELVHQTGKQSPGAPDIAWNGEFSGKKLPSDVYLYEARVLFGDGEKQVYKGDVLLLR